MRSFLLLGLLLVAAGAVAWYLIDGGSGDGAGGGYDDAPIDAGDEDGGPGLTAAGKKSVSAPSETRGRGWIQGTVTRDGAPAAASVELRHVDSIDPRNPLGSGIGMVMIGRMLDSGVSVKPVLDQVSAGDDGRFRFMGLAPGRYEVRATADDGAMGFTPASLPALGARVEASVELPAGTATLTGRVEHKDGSPYRGLVVATTGDPMAVMFGGGGEVRPTRTDDEGRFRFGGLNPGKMSVSAIVPGVMRVMGPPVTVPHQGEYVLTIDAGGVTTKGRVIAAADETAVAGATVFGGGGDPNTSFSIRSTTTDGEGRFALTLPSGRGGGFMVQADGYAPATVNMRDSSGDDVTVTLVALGQITGRVATKENGTPVAGVTIFARAESSGGGFPVASSTVTDRDGRYILADAAPGVMKIHALGAGWVSVGYTPRGGATPYAAEVEPGQDSEVDIEVIPGARASGRVTTPSGEPIVGAVVQGTNDLGMSDMWTALLGMGSSFGASVTDEQGGYEIDVLAPGSSYKITARAPDYPDAQSESFTADAGKIRTIDLQMVAPRWLRVRVVDAEDGTPLGGASVALNVAGSGMMDLRVLMRAGGTSTDASGYARVGPLSGDKTALRVSAPGYVPQQNVPYEDDGSDAPTLTVELTRGLVFGGRVVVPEGVPVQSVRLTVQRTSHVGGRYFYENPPVQADGTFRVDTIPDDGSYKARGDCTWKDRRFGGEVVADAGTEDVLLEMKEQEGEDLGTLVVKVTDAAGKAVPSGRIQLSQFELNSHHGTSADLSGGKATLRNIRPDAEIWVEVYQLIGDRGAIIEGPFDAKSGEIEVRLPTGRSIEGRAVGPDGKGVRGVRVTATAKHPNPNRESGEEHGTAVSDEDGRFVVKHLGDLEYELYFKTPKDFGPAPSQTARAGATGVSVKLRMGLKATLTIVDFAGKPLPGASAYARSVSNNARSWSFEDGIPRADRDGKLQLTGLDPDATFHLSINPPDGRQDLKVIQRQKWRPRDETIRMEQAWSITGRVKDQKGKPAVGVWVRARLEGSKDWTGSAHTDDGGRFDMRNLDAGRYELRASPSHSVRATPGGGQAADEEGIVVRAGTKNVELTVDLGEKLVVRVRGIKALSGNMPNGTLYPDKGGQNISGGWQAGGRLVFQGLQPGVTYTLWILNLPESRYVHEKGVSVQEDELEVDSQAGGRIHGTVSLPAGVPLRNVGIGAGSALGAHAQAVVDRKTGTFKIEGLPEGEYTIHAHAWHDGKSYQAQAQARTGGEVELALKPR